MKVKDKVTGLTGIVTCVCFDLYGCVQLIINPGIDSNGKSSESVYIDVGRVEVVSTNPVMTPPNYDYGPIAEGKKGPAEKPRKTDSYSFTKRIC